MLLIRIGLAQSVCVYLCCRPKRSKIIVIVATLCVKTKLVGGPFIS